MTISHLARAAAIAACAACAACAPAVDGPAERQRALDREDGERLAAQLAAIPGVVRAEVVLRRGIRDPLAAPAADSSIPAAAGASIVVIIDDGADPAAISSTAGSLLRALAPELQPAIVVEVGAPRPHLAKVGPFTVEAASRTPLRAALAAALALIVALAGWIAWTAHRRGNSAQ